MGVASAVVLAAQVAAAMPPRHLGSFGDVCVPRPGRAVSAVDAQPATRTPPRRLTVTLVIDLRCASTPEALRRVRDFHQSRPAVDLEILVLDPSAFARLEPTAAQAILGMDLGVPLRWDPGRLRALTVRAVPFFRIEDARGQIVTAFGVPSLDGILGALR